MSLRSLGRWSLLAALSCGPFVLAAPPASAHAELKSADPADGSALDTAPARLTLTFTEGASATRSSVTLGGRSLPLTQPAGHPDLLLADLGTSAAALHGPITVVWRSVSSDDGHVATGTLHYRIGGTTTAPAGPASPVKAVKDAAADSGLGSSAVMYGSCLGVLCLAFGGVVFVTVRRARRD